ncbi:MAG: heavy metal translocating P-type ATPase, partial [Rhodococcus sp. (in: high G+C Gram-positive bacteria)]
MRQRWVRVVLLRYLELSAAIAVGLAVLVLQIAGAPIAARWTASVFAIAIAAQHSVAMARDILRGHWGIDILAVTAIVSTVAVGEYGAAVIIVLMLTGGESLEAYAAGRATRELTALLDRVPRSAHRLTSDGERIEDVPVDEVAVDDWLLLRPAEVVPVDGVLLSPVAVFDESSLTGESLPVERSAGDAVLSGAVNGQRAVRIRATARAVDSQYSQIVELVREASASRAPMVRLADRYAVPFT